MLKNMKREGVFAKNIKYFAWKFVCVIFRFTFAPANEK